MAKLNFMHTIDDLMKYRAAVWETGVGEGSPPELSDYVTFPCLAKFVLVRHSFDLEAVGMAMVLCSKNEAKRIVYPKTNRNRPGMFAVIEGDSLKGTMEAYITQTLKRLGRSTGIDTSHPIQRRMLMLDGAVSDLDEAKGLALVISRTYTNLDRLRLINFYTVDEADARRLVYCDKKLKRAIGFEEFVHGYKKRYKSE